jgi:DNA-binding winged helix-turn-helix (wHTH) protein/tetratricopeptide (TPR) repeat protein
VPSSAPPEAATAPAAYRFGEFLLDPQRRVLLRATEPVALTAKAFDTLLALVERHGRLVGKDELMHLLWPRVVVEEANLSQNVFFVRKALGESAQTSRYIVTVQGKGYRFAEPVETIQAVPLSAPPVEPPPGPALTSGRRRQLWLPVLVAALIVVAAAIISARWLTRPPPKLAAPSRVLVSEFENKTGEPIFDDTLRQALMIELEQSPFLSISSDQQVTATLERMRRPRDVRLELAVALEVCQRDGWSAVIAGSIGVLARQYVITLQAVSCDGAQRLTGLQVTADSRDGVLTALGKAGSDMRLRLGESLSSVQKYDRPLAAATTSSLEALRAYSVGVRIMRFGSDVSAALPLFERATELDDNFAMAYAYHALTLSQLGEYSRSAQLQQRAYELRDRVSERERLHIISAYHMIVTGNLDQEMSSYETWLTEFPRDWIPVMMLGETDAALFGNYALSAERLERARALGAQEWHSELLLSIAYSVAGRVGDARKLLQDSLQRGADSNALHVALVRIAKLTSDDALLEEQRRWSARQPAQDNIAYIFEIAAASHGRFGEMRALVDAQDPALNALGLVEAAALDSAGLALAQAQVGAAAHARNYANASLAEKRSRGNLPLVALAFAFIRDVAAAQSLVHEMEQSFPQDVIINRIYVPVIRAVIAGHSGSSAAAAALPLLTPSLRYALGSTVSFLPLYVSGITRLRAGDSRLATIDFQTIIQNRAVSPLSVEWVLAHLGLARAHAASGDTSDARSAYEQFLELWESADADTPILQEAQRELAALTVGSGRP